MPKTVARYVFTFGHGQKHFPGYVIVYASGFWEARHKMTSEYGPLWSMQYDNEEQAGVRKFNLPLIAILTDEK